MLRRSFPLRDSLRSRKKYPYLVSHNKLPWNTVEPGSADAHKLLAPCFVRVFEFAMNNRASAATSVVRTEHPPLTPDEWIFHLPSTSYIVAETKEDNAIPLEMVAPFEGWGSQQQQGSADDQQQQDASSASSDSCGKRVTDPMCLAHYGPLHVAVGAVEAVAEFRSPDLRIVGNAVRVRAPLKLKPAPFSAMWTLLKKQHEAAGASPSPAFVSFSLFHYYRPNRAPSELEAAFDKFVPRERPDLTALTSAEPLVSGAAAGKKGSKGGPAGKLTPMPIGPVPSSPLYGLMEREAVKPGDTFGCRSRMWGNHW